jgi:hypothetical protein
MQTPTVDVCDAPRDAFRERGYVFTFDEYGRIETPLPDDLVTLTDGDIEEPGRVYAVDFGKQLVYVEPDQH